MISYKDDEPIIVTQDPSGKKRRPFLTAKTSVKIINNDEARLEKTTATVLLELTGSGSGNGRSGVDIVVVLDVRNNMKGNELEDMKTAMQFLIRKLSPIDRLSVITMGTISDRLFVLRQMTETAQPEIEEMVNVLRTVEGGGPEVDVSDSLKSALAVLKDRTLATGRVPAIMLVSGGDKNSESVISHPVDFPVYTFGFGNDYNPKVLNAIANKSNGGTFSIVQAENKESGNLTIAFSQCLAGLLTVAVHDLKLIVSTNGQDSIIIDVSAGNYVSPESKSSDSNSVKISCGDLYSHETRKVVVTLDLPTVPDNGNNEGAKVLDIQYSYRVDDGEMQTMPPLWVSISRKKNPGEKEKEELTMENTRIRISKKMTKARELADKGEWEKAQLVLVEAQCVLEDAASDKPGSPLINMLRYELLQFLKFVQTPEIYQEKGQAFALASETSHNRQRFAARGHAEMLRLFTTPRMDAYLEQANSFVEDSTKPLPTTMHDAKAEIAADPLATILDPFLDHIIAYNEAFRSKILSEIQKKLDDHTEEIKESLENQKQVINKSLVDQTDYIRESFKPLHTSNTNKLNDLEKSMKDINAMLALVKK